MITRSNPAQVFEAALGKIAEITGKPYKVRDFDKITDLRDYVQQELRKHGLQDREDIIDGTTGRKIRDILTGNRFMMKLHHTSESKQAGRGTGGYTAEGLPAKGGPEGSKRLSLMHVNALLSHGATEVLRDAHLYRGQANPEHWRMIMSGYDPPTPDTPQVFNKFLATLQGAGINIKRTGSRFNVMAMTNKDVDELTGGRTITSSDTVDWKDRLNPIKGGLFDPTATGGPSGSRWSAIQLHEPMPNPVMEEPIRRLLGLTRQQFLDTIAGKHKINDKTGPSAIADALDQINLDRELERTRADIAGSRKTARSAAIKKIGFLKAAKELDLHPRDWMLSSVPVLPPIFRPVSLMSGNKLPMVSDANYLYKEVFDANKNLQKMSDQVDDLEDERLAVYHAFKGVVGLGDPTHPKNQERQVKGLLRQVFGCYDDQTEILTQNGWVKFEDLPADVPVATLNPVTHAFEWQVPTERQKYRYVGELLKFSAGTNKPRLDLLVTPSHRHWTKIREKQVPDITKGWEILEAWQAACVTNRQWWRVAAAEWRGHTQVPDCTSATLEVFAEFVGWWVAEGWIHSDGKIVNVCQERVGHTEYCRQIEAVVARLGIPYTVGNYTSNNGSDGKTKYRLWSIKSEALAVWLTEHCGKGARNKKLSRFVKDWDTPALIALFHGYMRGDGAKRGNEWAVKTGVKQTHRYRSALTDDYVNFTSTSHQLLEDFSEVCCKIGIVLRPGVGVPARGNRREQYVANICGNPYTQTEGKTFAKPETYDGHVYCCTVPNGIVFVRRNGIPVFSGNSSPKHSTVQRKLLGSNADLVGRAVITPDPDLDMDEVGIPEESAWHIYQPLLVRRLVRQGMSRVHAAQAVKTRKPEARTALLKEMSERPVMIDRAPVLWRYGVMAFRPKIVADSSMHISPMVVSGFGADFDGDAMQFHVPSTDDAAQELLEKLLPSRNLLSTGTFKVHQVPGKEYVAGLYNATAEPDMDRPEVVFNTPDEALRAYKEGRIGINRRVRILNMPQS